MQIEINQLNIMGWKASAIVINTINEETNFEEILNSIGFNNLEKIEDLPFDSAIYPEENTIYVGIYKGNLIITARNLPLYFIDPGSNIIERRITQLYPETEIYALSLNSVINHWAFAIIQNGKKIRIKAGDMDQGTVLDVGQPLEQELELLSKSRLNSKGEREYYFGDDGEFDREHQVGESFVFDIFKRYTGERLDMDDELFETVFFGYKSHSFAGPSLIEITYCGEWEGCYTYGQGYRDSIRGKNSHFLIRMEVENGNLKGTSKEENKEPANINGFMIDNFIGFVHQYPISYRFNDQGESIADSSKPGSKVYYSGLFDHKTNSFRGIWRIDGRENWGEWTMKSSRVSK